MLKKKRILIIDDEKDFCFFVKNTLEEAGEFEVLTAHNGKEGMVMISSIKPDLVLLDVVMPEVSGPDVAEFLVESAQHKHIPFIFLTAIVTKDEIGTGSLGEIKGHAFLQKPVDIQTLRASIKTMLKKGEQEKLLSDILSGKRAHNEPAD